LICETWRSRSNIDILNRDLDITNYILDQ